MKRTYGFLKFYISRNLRRYYALLRILNEQFEHKDSLTCLQAARSPRKNISSMLFSCAFLSIANGKYVFAVFK